MYLLPTLYFNVFTLLQTLWFLIYKNILSPSGNLQEVLHDALEQVIVRLKERQGALMGGNVSLTLICK